mgnify:CR=1 FL=1
MTHAHAKIASFSFGHLGWRSYNTIKKKAMEQEFPAVGGRLLISMSIAFFIVVGSASALNIIYQTLLEKNKNNSVFPMVYRLEKNIYLNADYNRPDLTSVA